MSKKGITCLSLFYGAFLILAVVFFFFDLEISKVLVSEEENFVYVLLAAIGEFPIYIGPILFGMVYGFIAKTKWTKMLYLFVGLIATYIGVMRLSGGIFEYYLNSEIGLVENILLAIASFLLFLLLFIVFSKIDIKELNKIKDVVLIAFIVSISSFLIVTITKYIWGRPRYRILSTDEEYVNFLTIDGFRKGIPSDDYRSFPSGHTNASASILVLSLLPARIIGKKWVKYIINIFCILYPIVVAISRIGIGAHYASDVLFGFGISFTCFMITYIIFKKKGWLYVRGD